MNWTDKGDVSYCKVDDINIEIRVSKQEVIFLKENRLNIVIYPYARTRSGLKKIVKEELKNKCV